MKTCEEMAEDVLRRRDEYLIRRKKQRTALISSCACLALIAGIGFGMSGRDPQLPVAPDVTQGGTESQYVNMEDIHINYVGSTGEGKSKIDGILTDMDVRTESSLSIGTLNEQFTEYLGISYEDFMEKLPKGLELDALYELKARNGPGENNYSLHDYIFNFKYPASGGELRLAVSPFGEPLRDWFIEDEAPLISEINGEELIIVSHGEILLSVFDHKGIWYDVEANGISLEEFVIFLNYLIK